MKDSGAIFSEMERLIDLSLTRKAFLLVSSGHWIPATDIYETPRDGEKKSEPVKAEPAVETAR
jgi:hypothetical protein